LIVRRGVRQPDCRAADPSSLAALGAGLREDFRDFFGVPAEGFDRRGELQYGLRK
jgi:hypothetical protein